MPFLILAILTTEPIPVENCFYEGIANYRSIHQQAIEIVMPDRNRASLEAVLEDKRVLANGQTSESTKG